MKNKPLLALTLHILLVDFLNNQGIVKGEFDVHGSQVFKEIKQKKVSEKTVELYLKPTYSAVRYLQIQPTNT